MRSINVLNNNNNNNKGPRFLCCRSKSVSRWDDYVSRVEPSSQSCQLFARVAAVPSSVRRKPRRVRS